MAFKMSAVVLGTLTLLVADAAVAGGLGGAISKAGRSDWAMGREVTHGTYTAGGHTSAYRVEALRGNNGSIHSVNSNNPHYPNNSHTTLHNSGVSHHHGEHMSGRSNSFTK